MRHHHPHSNQPAHVRAALALARDFAAEADAADAVADTLGSSPDALVLRDMAGDHRSTAEFFASVALRSSAS